MAFVNESGTSGAGADATLDTPSHSLTAGNLQVLAVRWGLDDQTISSVVDTAGNTYTSIGTRQAFTAGWIQFFYCLNCLGSGTNVVTATFTDTVRFWAIATQQHSTIQTSGALDATVQTTATSATATSPSFSTDTANELLLATATWNGQTPSAAGGSYTLGTVYGELAIEYQYVTTTQSNVTATMDAGGSASYGIVVGTFRQASASAATRVFVSRRTLMRKG